MCKFLPNAMWSATGNILDFVLCMKKNHIHYHVAHVVLWFDNSEFILTRNSKLCITDEFVACIGFQMVNISKDFMMSTYFAYD